MSTVLYWIRCKDHNDMFSQGYVGVSKNPVKRWAAHAKRKDNLHLLNAVNLYGWNNLVKEIILVAEEQYCYEMEQKLRGTKGIGWNVAEGGNIPPSNQGKIRPDHTAFMKGLRQGDKHPMWGVKGKNHPSYKGPILATNIITGQQIYIEDSSKQKMLGFHKGQVSLCVNGKRKSHKGYTFKRLEA